MDRIVLSTLSRADLGRASVFSGGANTFLIAGELAVAQRLLGGGCEESVLVLPSPKDCLLSFSMKEREIRYDGRIESYTVMVHGTVYCTRLAEKVVAASRELLRGDCGVARLSMQGVSVGLDSRTQRRIR